MSTGHHEQAPEVRGVSIVAGEEVRGTAGTLRAFAASSGEPVEPEFGLVGAAELERATTAAAEAFQAYRATTPTERADFLASVAEEIERDRNPIVTRAMLESGLPEARLVGELFALVGDNVGPAAIDGLRQTWVAAALVLVAAAGTAVGMGSREPTQPGPEIRSGCAEATRITVRGIAAGQTGVWSSNSETCRTSRTHATGSEGHGSSPLSSTGTGPLARLSGFWAPAQLVAALSFWAMACTESEVRVP